MRMNLLDSGKEPYSSLHLDHTDGLIFHVVEFIQPFALCFQFYVLIRRTFSLQFILYIFQKFSVFFLNTFKKSSVMNIISVCMTGPCSQYHISRDAGC